MEWIFARFLVEIFSIGCQAHPTRKIEATKEGAAGFEVGSLADTKKKNKYTKINVAKTWYQKECASEKIAILDDTVTKLKVMCYI